MVHRRVSPGDEPRVSLHDTAWQTAPAVRFRVTRKGPLLNHAVFLSGGFRKAPSPPRTSRGGFTPMRAPPARTSPPKTEAPLPKHAGFRSKEGAFGPRGPCRPGGRATFPRPGAGWPGLDRGALSLVRAPRPISWRRGVSPGRGGGCAHRSSPRRLDMDALPSGTAWWGVLSTSTQQRPHGRSWPEEDPRKSTVPAPKRFDLLPEPLHLRLGGPPCRIGFTAPSLGSFLRCERTLTSR